MSRSNNVDLKNPSQRFFKWSGSDGTLSFYDKEEKENVPVPVPFHFLVLDRLVTIGGYSDEDKSGFWSNEIRNTKTETLTVRTKAGIRKEGLYEVVKNLNGAKYCQSLYIAFYNDEKVLTIGNLKLSGCAVSAWIEFSKGRDVYQGAISIKGKTEDKKGATKFFSPVFDQNEKVSEALNDAANKLDVELQDYLKAYFTMRGQAVPEQTTEDYIEQRNKELEDYGEKAVAVSAGSENAFGNEKFDWKDAVGGNDFSNPNDDDIPF